MNRNNRNDQNRVLKPGRTILGRTLILMAVCGIAAFAVLIGRLYQLMVVEHDEYERLAVEQQTRETSVRADRGTITDRNGNILAISATAYNVFLSPNELHAWQENAAEENKTADLAGAAEEMAEILGVDYDTIMEKAARTDSMYEVIARRVEAETADQIRDVIAQYDVNGIYLEETARRYYPYGELASHVIGFVGTDGNGLGGIEAYYEDELAGTNGSIVRLTDAQGGDLLFSNYEYYYDAVDGNDLSLTLDMSAQHIAEKYLEQAIADYDVLKGGCCIIMDVNTGGILAMASQGDFDPNDAWTLQEDAQDELDVILDPALADPAELSEDELYEIYAYEAMSEEERQAAYDEAYENALYDQWRNRAVSDTYEPGSVFKTITLAMALEEGRVTRGSSFYCDGSMHVLGRDPANPLHCWRTSGHGSQTLAEAVQNSCNVAFTNIGLLVGAQSFYQYVEGFGLFDPTGIDLPGEGGSVWWTEDVFFDAENQSQLASASFGQTFNITPLQMITAYSAAVNGGYLMEPYVVTSITDEEGDAVFVHEDTVVRQVISEETSAVVREILESVVSDGTGGNAAVAGYRIGGKTGTSEKVAQDAAGGEKEYMVSFCGFAPADDPEVAVLLILDTPDDDTGLYISGGNMAAPTVGGIFSELLPYLGYEPQYTEEEAARLDVKMPALSDMSLSDAQAKLDGLGLSYEIRGTGGTVTGQLPAANLEIAAGSTVILYAGGTPGDEGTEVPDLYGLSVSDAVMRLSWYGLYLDTTGASPAMENVVVSWQAYDEGEYVPCGTVVEVILADPSDLGVY